MLLFEQGSELGATPGCAENLMILMNSRCCCPLIMVFSRNAGMPDLVRSKRAHPPFSLSLKDRIKFLMLFYFMNLIDKFTNRKK